MSAIEAALDRGRAVAPKKGTKWEPADVTYRGRLVAVLKNTETDQLERVYKFKGAMLHEDLGRLADGTVSVHTVRDRTLRKMADAMLGKDKHQDDLVREGWGRTIDSSATASPKKKVKRGAKS